MGGRGHEHPRAAPPLVARQPLQGAAEPAATASRHRAAQRGSAGPQGRARPGRRQARARSGGRRRAQSPDDRCCRLGQIDARDAAPLDPSGADAGRDARSFDGAFARRRADGGADRDAPTVPRAASLREHGRARRRRRAATTGRSVARAPRRPIPRRTPRVRAQCARQPAPASGIGRNGHRARQSSHHVPLAHPARRGDEPVQVRRRGARPDLPARPALRGGLPGAPFRTAARSHRSADRDAAGAGGRSRGGGADGGQCQRSRPCHRRTAGAAGAVCPARRQARAHQRRLQRRAARRDCDARCGGACLAAAGGRGAEPLGPGLSPDAACRAHTGRPRRGGSSGSGACGGGAQLSRRDVPCVEGGVRRGRAEGKCRHCRWFLLWARRVSRCLLYTSRCV